MAETMIPAELQIGKMKDRDLVSACARHPEAMKPSDSMKVKISDNASSRDGSDAFGAHP
jgi:hypothetical protein